MVFEHAPTAGDSFVEGEYLHERRGHVAMPVRVWWGPPRDLEHGGFMDRSPRWNIEISGVSAIEDERSAAEPVARLADFWPKCLGDQVGRGETAYRQARRDHAQQHDLFDPFGEQRGRVDLLTATIPH